jgi:hypothetical protein
VANPHSTAVDKHSDNVEPIALARTPVPADPGGCRTGQFTLFSPVHRLYRVAEVRAVPRFDFYEGDESAALHDEVDVAVARAITTLQHAPSRPLQPLGGDAFAQYAETRPFLCHAPRIRQNAKWPSPIPRDQGLLIAELGCS